MIIKLKDLYYYLVAGNLYFVLATGKILPIDENGSVVHIFVGALNLCIFTLLAAGNKNFRKYLEYCLINLLPLLVLMGVMLIFSFNLSYAFGKIEGGILSSIYAGALAALLIEKFGTWRVLEIFTKVSFIFLLLTVAQRSLQGLEGREGLFLFNGPIVFGWLMGLNAVINLLLYTKEKKFIFICVFLIYSAAVFVSQSKGPVIALVAITLPLIIFGLNKKVGFQLFLRGGLIAGLCFLLYEYFLNFILFSESRFSALGRFVVQDLNDSDEGSIGLRLNFIQESLNLWQKSPIFGVGLGNWGPFLGYEEFKYPHNIFAELLSEMGLIGLFFMIFLFCRMLIRVDVGVRYLVLFLLICLSFSGDASYWRILFFLPIAVMCANRKII